ncbi:MAG: hypothetical protein WED05_11210 [Candidatus Atabeyarchaeum deiterrae]
MDELRTINITEYLDDIYYRWKVEVKDSNGYRASWFDDWQDVLEQVQTELKPVKTGRTNHQENAKQGKYSI